MEVVFFLLPMSLLLVGGFVVLFHWSVRSGQFDDMETPAIRMLFDDEEDAKLQNRQKVEENAPNRAETAEGR